MKKKVKIAVYFLELFFLSSQVHADYTQELEDQIMKLKLRYSQNLDLMYFHDMGIIARKADEAELQELTITIIRSHLFAPMDEYVGSELQTINDLYPSDSYQASKRLSELLKMNIYFEPSDEFLLTAPGKAIAAEIARNRTEALGQIRAKCSDDIIRKAVQAIRKTGLFFTNSPDEIGDMRDLSQDLSCCISWKPTLQYHFSQSFETDYEAGKMLEDAKLKLVSSPNDLSQAQWTGEWRYTFQGKEGKGEGTSQATLRYQRGDETSELVISSARMNSVGRINMPMSLSGDRQTLEMEGMPIYPEAIFKGQIDLSLAGCREDAVNP